MVESITAKISLLPDPYGDRNTKSLDPPPNKPLENNYLYPHSGMHILIFIVCYPNMNTY